MDLCNDHTYFEQKLEVKKKEIKNEMKIKRYAKQILMALAEIHVAGIIHADLKLPNILLHRPGDGQEPIVKLCDFGIAQIITPSYFNGERKALMRERSGTAYYIAPEVKHANVVVGPEIDIWAFGIVLYEMCVAYKPN
jgi:serine/threonine protein kinase